MTNSIQILHLDPCSNDSLLVLTRPVSSTMNVADIWDLRHVSYTAYVHLQYAARRLSCMRMTRSFCIFMLHMRIMQRMRIEIRINTL